jgi:hypothetical protein
VTDAKQPPLDDEMAEKIIAYLGLRGPNDITALRDEIKNLRDEKRDLIANYEEAFRKQEAENAAQARQIAALREALAAIKRHQEIVAGSSLQGMSVTHKIATDALDGLAVPPSSMPPDRKRCATCGHYDGQGRCHGVTHKVIADRSGIASGTISCPTEPDVVCGDWISVPSSMRLVPVERVIERTVKLMTAHGDKTCGEIRRMLVDEFGEDAILRADAAIAGKETE